MKLQAAAVFSSDLVLQRETDVPLWGAAAPGAVVTAGLDPAGVTAEGTADASARWQVVGPDTAAELSAVAYYAARELARALDVHVGILECFWGGTYAHCWLPRDLLAAFPEGRRRLEWYDARVGDKTDAQFEAECIAYQKEVDAWNERIAARRAVEPDVSWTVLNEECGLYPWPPPAGRTGYQRPGNLYESMLRRVCPYALRGFWYYQGEQDEEWPADYETELTCLVRRWRADWQDKEGRLPFLLVQLPMYATGVGAESWPTLRAAQAAVAGREPNAGLVVLADLGEADNIHPVDKEPVGRRLALLALQTVYGLPVAGRAPRLTQADGAGGKAILRFVDTGGGLQLQEGPSGFELAGADGIFAPASATAEGDTVTLHSPAVARPAFVRYAWYNYGPAALHGGTGLPAQPFGATPLTHTGA